MDTEATTHGRRLASNTLKVREVFLRHPGRWLTKDEIRWKAQLRQRAELTARIRDLRDPKGYGMCIKCKRQGQDYLYAYFPAEDDVPF